MKRNKGVAKFIKNNLPTIIGAVAYAQEDSNASGAEKLETAAKWLNSKVDIPLLPEWVEEQIFKVALTTVVELAKSIWGDKQWFDNLVSISGLDS